MAEKKYTCNECGHVFYSGFAVVCPECNSLDLAEEQPGKKQKTSSKSSGKTYNASNIHKVGDKTESDIYKVVKKTKFDGFNRILSKKGGFVQSQIALIAAEPGAMKSTICTQISDEDTLYISTEETVSQVQDRFTRVNPNSGASILCTTDADEILAAIKMDPHPFFVLDSPNMIENGSLSYAAVANLINNIVAISKANNKTAIIVSQVTANGDRMIGYRSIEHAVDTMIFCQKGVDGDSILVTTNKNRFNVVGECVFFRHTNEGLVEVNTLDSVGEDLSGTILFNYLTGSRKIPTTIMALVVPTNNKFGERITVGFDPKRLKQILAVLTYNCPLFIANDKDVYVSSGNGLNLGGGADLACCAAILSCYFNKVIRFSLDDLEGKLSLNGSIIGNRKFTHIKQIIRLFTRN